MSMPRSSGRRFSAALLVACLFLESASHPAAVLFAQAVSEPAAAVVSGVAPIGGSIEAVIPEIVPAGPVAPAFPVLGVQNQSLAAAPAAPLSKESKLRFIASLRRDLVWFTVHYTPESFNRTLARLLGPGADEPEELASALTIAEACTRPETLPALLPRLERMERSRQEESAADLLIALARRFLWGSAADADSARRRLHETIRNIPGLQTRARTDPESARILDVLFDGRLASLGEAPAQAVGRPAGGVDGRAPKPDPLSLSRAAARLRRAMKFGFEPTFTNKRMEEIYQVDPEGHNFWAYRDEKIVQLRNGLRKELKPTRESEEEGISR